MAEFRCKWLVATFMLCSSMGAFVCAQSTGSLSGRLTSLHSIPLAGVAVEVRNQQSGQTVGTFTTNNGLYSFHNLPAGLYTLSATSTELGQGELNDILVQPGHEARITAAMDFQPIPPVNAAVWAKAAPQQAAPPTGAQPVVPARTGRATLPAVSAGAAATTTVAATAQPAKLPEQTLRTTPPPVLAKQQELPASRPQPTRVLTQQAAVSTRPPVAVPLPPPIPPHVPIPVKGKIEQPELAATLAAERAVRANQQAVLVARPQTAQLAGPQTSQSARPGADSATAAIGAHASPIAQRTPAAAPPRSIDLAIDLSDPEEAVASSSAEEQSQSSRSLQPAAKPTTVATQQPSATLAPPNSSTLGGDELRALPANGRRWEEFTLEAPSTNSAGSEQRTETSGSGQGAADTAVDGVSTRLAFASSSQLYTQYGQDGTDSGSLGQPWAGGRGMAISEAAIRQLNTAASNVQRSASRSPGGRVEVMTASGSEQLHGQAFVYSRQNFLNARNPYSNWIKETSAATATTLPVFSSIPYTPPSRDLTLGLGLGSHILPRRLFWFAALDHYQKNDPAVSTVKHPDLFFEQPTNDRMQVLGAQLGSGSLAIPMYSWMLENLTALMGPASRTAEQWVGFGRMDWKLGERDQITAEATSAYYNAPGGGLSNSVQAYGNHSLGHSLARETWLIGRWRHYLTENLLAVSQASVGHTVQQAKPETPSTYEQTLNINTWGQLPQIVVDSRYGFTIGNPSRFGQGDYPNEWAIHAQQALDWVRGPMLFRAGLQFDHNADRTTMLRNQTGTYHYSNVANFITDALAYQIYGIGGELNKYDQHNCDQTGKAWRTSAGTLRGLGYLPCYSYYTQTMGPADRHVSVNEWAAFATGEWNVHRSLVLSAGLRWELEQLPRPIALVNNPDLPRTQRVPSLGSNWGPRLSLAWRGPGKQWPALQLGYGIYYGSISNSTLETVMTQTGSASGILHFYTRPTDNLLNGGAPPFPYVYSGEPTSMIKPAALEFAPDYRVPEVHQAVVTISQSLPAHIHVAASASVSLGRHLPITEDTNIDSSVNPSTITYRLVDPYALGPIPAATAQTLTLPFYSSAHSASSGTTATGRSNNNYQQVVELQSRANSTYEAASLRLSRTGRRGLSLYARYTYAHAMDWNPNESLRLLGGSMMDPANFGLEYGVSNLDVRHSASIMAILQTPWTLRGLTGKLANNWRASAVGYYRSGLPYTIRTGGSIPKRFTTNGAAIVGLAPGINGSGGDNRMYGLGGNGIHYNLGRNSYRYPESWKLDLRLAKSFDLKEHWKMEFLAESFNLFNHRNVTSLETVGYTVESGSSDGSLPTLTFMSGAKAGSTAFGKPFSANSSTYYRPRQFDFGLRLRF